MRTFQFPEYERAATPGSSNVLVVAGAGAGKTTVLTERVLRLLEQCAQDSDYNPDKVSGLLRGLVLVTFTKAAATELQERVRRGVLESRASAADARQAAFWTRVRDELDDAHIGTIDSFCHSLMVRHAETAGIAPGFTDIDDASAATALRHAARDALQDAFLENAGPAHQDAAVQMVAMHRFERTVRLLETASRDTCYNGLELLLDPAHGDRIEAIRQEIEREILGQASATIVPLMTALSGIFIDGNGKTETKCRECVERAGAYAASFSDTLTLADASSLAEGNVKERFPLPGNLKREWVPDFKECIDELRLSIDMLTRHLPAISFIPHDAIAAIRPQIASLHLLAGEVRRRYREWKRGNAVLDFGDLIDRAYGVLSQPEILDDCRRAYRHLWIDEFQDTSRAQAALLFSLAGERGQPRYEVNSTNDGYRLEPGKFFAVGDPKQSIYRFRAADVTVFEETRRRIEAEGGEILVLEHNFRSVPDLVNHHNSAFARIFENCRHPFDAAAQDLLARREDAASQIAATVILLHGDPETKSRMGELRRLEAAQLARLIRTIVELDCAPLVHDRRTNTWRAPGYQDIAVLFQVGTNLPVYEGELRRLAIPYYIHAGRGFFSVEEVSDLLHALRVIRNPGDDVSLVGWLRSPMAGLSDAGLYNLSKLRGSWFQRLGEAVSAAGRGERFFTVDDDAAASKRAFSILSELISLQGSATLPELLERLLNLTSCRQTILGTHHGEQKRANIDKIMAMARDLSDSRNIGLAEFIEHLEERRTGQDREGEASLSSEDEACVTLMTIHGSKGLEFPIVIVPDLVRDRFNGQQLVDYHRLIGMTPRGIVLSEGVDPEDEEREPPAEPIGKLIRLLEVREENAERRRLLYVASTRARDALFFIVPHRKIAELAGRPEPLSFDPIDLRRMLSDSHDLTHAAPSDNPAVSPTGARWHIRGEIPRLEGESWSAASPLFDRENETLRAGMPLANADEAAGMAIVAACTKDFRPASRRRAFHTTGILTYDACPKRYAFKYVHGIPEYGVLAPALPGRAEDEDAEPDEDRAAEVGTVVHAALARVDFNNPGELRSLLQRSMQDEEIHLEKGDLARCEQNVRWVIEKEFGARLKAATSLRREIDFRVRLGDGQGEVFILGRLDGLACMNGGWTVFDYKTNRQDGDVRHILTRYQRQLDIYRIAARRALGIENAGAELVCTDYETVLNVEADTQFENERLPALLEGLLRADYTATPTKTCHLRCPYGRICEAVADRF